MDYYYVKCKNCKHSDPTETYGYKWYCEMHGTYVDPDAIVEWPNECKYYQDR